MAVAADQRGWLGPFLLDVLLTQAAARGIPDIEADVLTSNGRMLALLRSRGDATMADSDWTIMRLVVGTAGRTPVWPPAAPGRPRRGRVLVESPAGRWAHTDEAIDAGLDVLVCRGPRGPRPRCPALAGEPCPLVAGADAVVVCPSAGDESWSALLDAHHDLNPEVPVLVVPRNAGDPAELRGPVHRSRRPTGGCPGRRSVRSRRSAPPPGRRDGDDRLVTFGPGPPATARWFGGRVVRPYRGPDR